MYWPWVAQLSSCISSFEAFRAMSSFAERHVSKAMFDRSEIGRGLTREPSLLRAAETPRACSCRADRTIPMLQVLSRGRYLVAAFTAALTLYALAVAWT